MGHICLGRNFWKKTHEPSFDMSKVDDLLENSIDVDKNSELEFESRSTFDEKRRRRRHTRDGIGQNVVFAGKLFVKFTVKNVDENSVFVR